MQRRRFLQLTASSCAVSHLTLPGMGETVAESVGIASLQDHRIDSITTREVSLHWPRNAGKNAKLGNHGTGPVGTVVILKTHQGASGWGMLNGPVKALDRLRETTKGKAVSELINPGSGILSPYLKPLDFALHDLAGVILDQPVWQMLGARTPSLFPIYSGMIYFDDLEPEDKPAGIARVLENCAADRDLGYRQLKVKIGRGLKWMPAQEGLQRDIEVVRAIARDFPDCEILVDGNDGYTADSLIEFLKGIDGIPLFWIEEPFVEDERMWRKVHQWTRANGRANTLLADGEQHNDFPLLEKLEADGILQVRLNDIAGYGFTRWRTLMPKLKETKILASPHCWGSGLKTIYTAHLCAALGNTATIEGVTCSDEDVDFGENVIANAKQQLSSKPGFGLTLRSAN